MKLYEIDQAIESLIDQDTGEVSDFDVFMDLQMAREAKIENVALLIKNLTAEAEAIKAEKNALAEREASTKNKVERLKNYLKDILCGEKFNSPKVTISFRKSASVEIDDGFVEWAKTHADHFLKYTEPGIDKTAIKSALMTGAELKMARIVENHNIQIK